MPRRITILALALLTAQVLALASRGSGTNEIEELRARIDQLEADNRALSNRVVRYRIGGEFKANWQKDVESVWHKERFAALPVDTKNFVSLPSNIGAMLVSVQNVSPYLDGFKLKLSVGNPQAMKVSRCEIRLFWGKKKVYAEEEWSLEDWADHVLDGTALSLDHFDWEPRANKTQQSVGPVPPGGWAQTEIVIAPATTADIKDAQTSIDVTTVQ